MLPTLPADTMQHTPTGHDGYLPAFLLQSLGNIPYLRYVAMFYPTYL